MPSWIRQPFLKPVLASFTDLLCHAIWGLTGRTDAAMNVNVAAMWMVTSAKKFWCWSTVKRCLHQVVFVELGWKLWRTLKSTLGDISVNGLTLYALNFSEEHIYLHFISFLHIDMTQVVEIISHIRPTYPTSAIPWLLMSWRRKEPGHQQPWYWPS